MRDLVGIEPTPHRYETRVITIGPDDGPVIFPVPFYRGLFQKIKFTLPAFLVYPWTPHCGEIVSVSAVKVLGACYRFLSTHTHGTVSQIVSLSTLLLFPFVEFLQLWAPVVDANSYTLKQGKVALLKVKLPCTIMHTLVLM